MVLRSSGVRSSRSCSIRLISERSWVISSSVGSAFARAQILDVRGGEKAFPVGDELLEVRFELGEVRGVASEVSAPDAGELVGTCVAAGLDIGWFGADAERYRDLPYPQSGMFVGEVVQPPRSGPVGLPSNWCRETSSTALRTRFSVTR